MNKTLSLIQLYFSLFSFTLSHLPILHLLDLDITQFKIFLKMSINISLIKNSYKYFIKKDLQVNLSSPHCKLISLKIWPAIWKRAILTKK